MRAGQICLALGLAGILSLPAAAQQQQQTQAPQQQGAGNVPQQLGAIRSPVLIVDSEKLYFESDFGRTQEAEFKMRAAELNVKNEEISADLEREEISLRDKREAMSPEAFRALADAFDEKVMRTRQEQVKASDALNAELSRDRDAFRAVARPVLAELMRDAGAAIILDERAVYLFVNAIDVTDEAIARLDIALGNGAPEAE
ncbi:MAG: OmpH family outer membrane protein [Sulfitobacter sp.]